MAIASFTMIAAQAIASAFATAAAWIIAFAPFVLLAAIIAVVVLSFWWLYKNWDMVWRKIDDFAGEMAEAIKNKIASIGDFFSKIGEKIKSAWKSAIDYISGLFDSLLQKWETVKGFAQKAGNFLGWGSDNQAKNLSMIPLRAPSTGNTTVTQTVNLTVPTAAAAGDAIRTMSDPSRNTVNKSQSVVRQ